MVFLAARKFGTLILVVQQSEPFMMIRERKIFHYSVKYDHPPITVALAQEPIGFV